MKASVLFINIILMTIFANAQGKRQGSSLQLVHSCKPFRISFEETLKGYADFEIMRDTKTGKFYAYSPSNKFSNSQTDPLASKIPNYGFGRLVHFQKDDIKLDEMAIPVQMQKAPEALIRAFQSNEPSSFQASSFDITSLSLVRNESLFVFPGVSERGLMFNNVLFLKSKDKAYDYTTAYMPLMIGGRLSYMQTYICDQKAQ